MWDLESLYLHGNKSLDCADGDYLQFKMGKKVLGTFCGVESLHQVIFEYPFKENGKKVWNLKAQFVSNADTNEPSAGFVSKIFATKKDCEEDEDDDGNGQGDDGNDENPSSKLLFLNPDMKFY